MASALLSTGTLVPDDCQYYTTNMIKMDTTGTITYSREVYTNTHQVTSRGYKPAQFDRLAPLYMAYVAHEHRWQRDGVYDLQAGTRIYELVSGVVFELTKTVRFSGNLGPVKQVFNSYCKYVRTEIVYSPSSNVTNLTVNRESSASGLRFKASWKVPSTLTDAKGIRRAQAIVLEPLLTTGESGKGPYYLETQTLPINTTSAEFSIPNNKLFPYNSTTRATFQLDVKVVNWRGDSGYTGATYFILQPRKPEIAQIRHDAGTGRLSTTIKTDAGTGANHREDTRYGVSVYYSETNKTLTYEYKSMATSISYEITESNRQGIPYDRYVRYIFYAVARGARGESDLAQLSYYMSYPKVPVLGIKSISGDRAILSVNTNTSTQFPVTGVRMQRLVSVDYEKASDIPANASWQNVGPQDNGSCAAITLQTGDITPTAGKKTWLRLKTWNDVESVFYRYSTPLRVKQLETPAPVPPSAGDDIVVILSCVTGSDSGSAYVHLAWDPSGTDDSNNTELSWSERENAWKSNKRPDSFMLVDSEWNEGQVTSGGKTYRKSTHVYVSDLEVNVRYHFAARRVLIPKSGETSYGPYSTKSQLTILDASTVPSSVTLTAPSEVLRGDDIPLAWTFGGDVPQASWAVLKMVGASISPTDIVLSSGDDMRQFYNQSYWRDVDRTVTIASDENKYVTLYAMLVFHETTLFSNVVSVKLLDKPTFEVAAPSSVTVQPMSVVAFTNDTNVTVSLFISSRGVTGTDGITTTELPGDTIWSDTVKPEWEVIEEYASDDDVESARASLEDARAAYDAAVGEYEEADNAYQSALSSVESLTRNISLGERDQADAQVEVSAAREKLDGMDEEDALYEAVLSDYEEAVARLDAITNDLAAHREALTQAESDLTDAEAAIAQIDYSDEEAALNDALMAYSQAVASAIGPTDVSAVTHRAVIRLPEGLNLKDTSTYDVTAFSTSQRTGLRSDTSTSSFSVDWAHQAPSPSREITITPIDVTGDMGKRTLGAAIQMVPPARAFQTDVYDLYRVTKSGITLIASDIPTDARVEDYYAAFGQVENEYIIVCRTSDGSIEWTRMAYTLNESEDRFRSMVRIDWNGKYLELARNVAPSDTHEKRFVSHTHLDGSISGHWNRGVARTLSIGAAMVRGREAEQETLLRELARHEGPCLVRTTDGVWVEGNVQVDTIAFDSRTAKGDISISVTELTPTGAFGPEVIEQEG